MYTFGRREERINTVRARIERLESYTSMARYREDPDRWSRAVELTTELYKKLGIMVSVYMREVA